MEIDAVKLRKLAARARQLAKGVTEDVTRQRLIAAAEEYERRAYEVDMDDATGQ
jgi:hypothetical protein